MRSVFLCLALAACGSGDDGNGNADDRIDPISDAPLAGVINGVDWTFAVGETDDFLSDEDEFFATLSGQAGEVCGFGGVETDFILSVPTEPGIYPFTPSLNATFTFDNDNLVTFDGTVRVDTVTETEVTGAVFATFDEDNEIDGTFALTICSDDG